ncbi:RHS repeat-associated core domain-containing protein, partial [Escherichia marmotae]|nr:RHS repeat-associated core domain-containing protein [Escherichia marmotae]
ALGRRISKATYGRHTNQREQRRTTFVWEGFRLLQETTWQGKRTYLYDAEQPYTPVAAVTGRGESRKIWYYHTDVTGTVQEVSAADGTLVWAGYQAGFGENRGDISNSGAYFEQPLRLPGQYFDEETGLHYNLFRYYAPECGRFISQDPIGLAGGINLYAYAPNPLTYIDPLGLCKLRGSNGRFRSAQNIQEEIGGLPNFSGKTPGEIRQTLRNRGYSSVQAHSGGEVWTKALPDGNTVAVRLDPAMQRTRPRGFADEVPHVHIESLPTSGVVNGNYGGRNNPTVPVVKYDPSGNIAVTPQDSHIPMRPGRGPYR